MSFSEKVKLEVKRKSDFRCVVCGTPIVQIHHIIPQEEHGPDTIENAVALCAHCHNIYGGNPSKREELIKQRETVYKKLEERFNPTNQYMQSEEAHNLNNQTKEEAEILLECHISEKETFEQAATKIYTLIYRTGKRYPTAKRNLIVRIKEHRNKEGGYDQDMFELQYEFLLKCIMPFLHILQVPLGRVQNNEEQKNLEIEKLIIFPDKKEMKKAEEKLKNENYEIYKIQEEN